MKIGNSRRAFSFTEILFAVMIIAIGFIMIAAMFPVALKQTENSVSDTAAASLAREGVAFVDQTLSKSTFVFINPPFNPLVPDQNLPVLSPTVRFRSGARNAYELWQEVNNPDPAFMANFPALTPIPIIGAGPNQPAFSCTMAGEAWPLDFEQMAPFIDRARAVNGVATAAPQLLFQDVIYPMVAQNQIRGDNPRFAWVAFYKRDLTAWVDSWGARSVRVSPQAQVIVLALQNRNADAFTTADLKHGTGSLSPTRYDGCQLIPPNSPSTLVGGITLPGTPGGATDRSNTDAFVVISSDNVVNNSMSHGALNGHVYRLGTRIPGTSNSWEFAPGFSLSPGDASSLAQMGSGTQFSVYMLGMGRDPNNPAGFSGPAMDVACYSAFITVGNNN